MLVLLSKVRDKPPARRGQIKAGLFALRAHRVNEPNRAKTVHCWNQMQLWKNHAVSLSQMQKQPLFIISEVDRKRRHRILL